MHIGREKKLRSSQCPLAMIIALVVSLLLAIVTLEINAGGGVSPMQYELKIVLSDINLGA